MIQQSIGLLASVCFGVETFFAVSLVTIPVSSGSVSDVRVCEGFYLGALVGILISFSIRLNTTRNFLKFSRGNPDCLLLSAINIWFRLLNASAVYQIPNFCFYAKDFLSTSETLSSIYMISKLFRMLSHREQYTFLEIRRIAKDNKTLIGYGPILIVVK